MPDLAFAKEFHRREIHAEGAETSAGHERWPVCRVGLTGNTGMVDFNRAMLSFYAHPGVSRGNAAHYAHRAMDCVLSCETRVLVVDICISCGGATVLGWRSATTSSTSPTSFRSP